MSLVGEVWRGAKLEAVDENNLLAHSRAHAWLSSEPSASEDIEEILLNCSSPFPMHNW